MTPDGLPPDAAARDSLRPGRGSWRRDVIEGVTRRIAFAALPAVVLAVAARALRHEWDLVVVLAVTLVGILVPLSPVSRTAHAWRSSSASWCGRTAS